MIYWLIISQLLLAVFSFFVGKKRVIYPPFILNITFFLSSCLSLYYKYNIGYEIGLKTYLLIVGFNFAFTLVYMLFGVKTKAIKKVEIKEIYISNFKLFLLLGCQLLSLFLFILFFIKTMNVNSFGNLSEKINEFRVGISFEGKYVLPKYISIANNISYAIAISATYILSKNIIASKSKKVFLIKNLKLVPVYILYVPIILLMGERINILILFLVAFSSYFILYYKNKNSKPISVRKLVSITIILMGVLISIFSASRFLIGRGEDRSLIHYIVEYFGSSIVNLDYFLKNPTHTDCFGEETFFAINRILSNLGLVENFDSTYQLPFAIEGNTYTAYRKYFADFSYYGVILVVVLSIICLTFEKITYKSQKKQDYVISLYSYFFSNIFLIFYSDFFYGTYLSLGYLSIIIYTCIVLWFVTEANFIDRLNNKIKNKIIISNMKKKEVVSFDLYDTLINRYTNDNKEVYALVKKYCDENNIRIDEEYVSKRNKADTLKDVEIKNLIELYEEVNMTGDLETISKIEEYIELNVAYKNKENEKIYNKAIQLNKKIIITTDIHLSRNVIENILKKYDINYDKLYISSQIKKSKRNSSIFSYIEEDLGTKSIIHFGDNILSDKKNPRKSKWDAEVLDKKDDCNTAYDRFIETGVIEQESKYRKYGYQAMGPLLYFYAKWLQKECGKKKLFFLSRDGKVMKAAYDIVNPSNYSEYLYASRRSLIVPSIFKKENFDEIMKLYFYGKRITVDKFLHYMGLENKKINSTKVYDLKNKEDIEELRSYYEKYKKEIINNSKNQHELLLKYLGDTKELNIVDIGWFGNMQKSLENILSNKKVMVNGCYLGLLSKSDNKKGYLFENRGEECQIEEEQFNSLIEFIFSANHGSVLGYQLDGENIEPLLDKYEYENSETDYILSEIQIGALEFVKKFDEINKCLFIEKTPEESFMNIKNMFVKPTSKIAKDWGEIYFCDYDQQKIASPRNLFYYLIHPKTLMKDFKDSSWRQGFIKRLFKINLPYSTLMKWYKRRKYNGK